MDALELPGYPGWRRARLNHQELSYKFLRPASRTHPCRKLTIAKIIPLPLADEFDAELLALAAAGLVKLPKKKLDLDAFFSRKKTKGRRIPLKRLADAVIADREERDASLLGR